MSDAGKEFHELIAEIKSLKDKTPKGILASFVHFLRELKKIIQKSPIQDREMIFELFQKEQKEFEKAMAILQIDQKNKTPKEMEVIKQQVESEEFKNLIKTMSEELFEIVKIMSEGK